MGIVIGTTIIAGIVGRILYKRSGAKLAPAAQHNAAPAPALDQDQDTGCPPLEPAPEPTAGQD